MPDGYLVAEVKGPAHQKPDGQYAQEFRLRVRKWHPGFWWLCVRVGWGVNGWRKRRR